MGVRHSPIRLLVVPVILVLLAGCGSTPTPSPPATPATTSTGSPETTLPTPSPTATRAPTTTPAFIPTGSMSVARSEHTATLLNDGRVLIVGGSDAEGYLDLAEIFDPITGKFSTTGKLHAPRTCHAATALADGRVLVIGGWVKSGRAAQAEIFDPKTESFSLTRQVSSATCGATATTLGDGRVLVAGGRDVDGNEPMSEAVIFDPATNGLTGTRTMMTEPRSRHTATLLPDGRVLLAGTDPSGSGAEGPHATAELFDPATGTFTATGRMAAGRSDHTATLLPNGRVLIAGGAGPGDRASAELYDPTNGTFTLTGEMTERRSRQSATGLGDGRVLIAGGLSRGVLSYAELYDPTSGAFAPAGWMAGPRTAHDAAALPDGRVLITGGDSSQQNSAIATAEVYEIERGAPPPSAIPTPAAARVPLRRSAAEGAEVLAAGRGGRLFVAVPDGDDTVLAALDAKGGILPGWPLRLPRASGCRLVVDPADGSIRAPCTEDGRLRTLVWAFDEAARAPPGWPVELPPGEVPSWRSDPARIVNGELYLVLTAWTADGQLATLVRVSRDGSLRTGVSTSDRRTVGQYASIGPDGAAYLVNAGTDSLITALTLEGLRPGYPIRIDGSASAPSFGPDGGFFVTVEATDAATGDTLVDSKATVVAYTPDGRVVGGWPVDIPVETWTRSGDGGAMAARPIAAPNGSVYVVSWHLDAASGYAHGTIAYTLGSAGEPRAGWPYESTKYLVTSWSGGVCTCMCDPCACNPYYDTSPLAGPGNTLYLAQSAGGEPAARGSSVVAVAADGQVKAGWPVTLVEKGAWFATFTVGADGTVFGFAVEPAGTRRKECGEEYSVYTGTVVALDGHGDTIYTTTLVTP